MKPVQSTTNFQWGISQGAMDPTSAPAESVEAVKYTSIPDDVRVQAPAGQQASQIAEARLQGDLLAAEFNKKFDSSTSLGVVTDNKDPDKLEGLTLDAGEPNRIALSPQGPGHIGFQTDLRGDINGARENDEDTSNVSFGWDLKQNSKG
jgi:hypothetical protein